MSIILVILYQIFLNQEKLIPEVVQTVSEVQLIENLNIGILDFDTINPLKSQNEHVQHLSLLIFEPLFSISKEFKLENCLAKEFNKLNDLTYIIKLNENIMFHDKTILNSLDVENTINDIKDNKNSIFFNNLKNVKNIKIIDEVTLRFELYNPESFFEYNLIFPIVKNNVLGTGKYIYNEDVLKYNENYWKDIDYKIKTINIYKYDGMGEIYKDFKNGNIDIIKTKESLYKMVLGEIGYNKKEYMGRRFIYLELNNIDIELRKAIYYAINKNEIISKVYSNNYYDRKYPLDVSNWLYKDTILYKYDIEKAIDVLENNNWKYKNNFWEKNNKKLEINLLLESSNEEQNEIAYIIKNQLEKIGICLNIEKVSENLYNYYLKKKKYDIIINTKYTKITPNIEEYFDNSITISEIQNLNNEREIIELYKRLEKEYVETLPFIGLCSDRQTLIYSEKIYGNITPNWYNIFYNIENWKKINKIT